MVSFVPASVVVPWAPHTCEGPLTGGFRIKSLFLVLTRDNMTYTQFVVSYGFATLVYIVESLCLPPCLDRSVYSAAPVYNAYIQTPSLSRVPQNFRSLCLLCCFSCLPADPPVYARLACLASTALPCAFCLSCSDLHSLCFNCYSLLCRLQHCTVQ